MSSYGTKDTEFLFDEETAYIPPKVVYCFFPFLLLKYVPQDEFEYEAAEKTHEQDLMEQALNDTFEFFFFFEIAHNHFCKLGL